jgi:enamine deaminase RidA (YjgF/YER057c/UK114 family)
MLITSEAGSELRVGRATGELVLATWTAGAGVPATEARVSEAYLALDEALAERGAVPIQERVFAEARAAAAVASGRARATAASWERWAVPPTVVEGAPVTGEGLAGIHVIGVPGRSRLLVEGDRVHGRVVETRHARFLGLADIGRRLADARKAEPAEEALAVLEGAAELLAREGFSFHDVVRTWFYLRDILDWYGPFNAARNAFFHKLGLVGAAGQSLIPASTGIEGRNARGGWCTLDLVAVRPANGAELQTRRLHNRRQNEATEYGSAFARALELVVGDSRHVFVSGTAAIDDHGATVHAGDLERQVRHTLEAVEALLEGANAGLSDLCQATAFLKRAADAPALERLVARSGIAGVPLVTTLADICRDDLLFEIDATAVVPVARRERE